MMTLGLALLAAISTGCTDGRGSIHTTGDPPFDISKARSVLWAQDPDTDEYEGMAALVISEQAMDCEALTTRNLYNNLDQLMFEGQGLMFLIEYDSWGNDAQPQDFEGLWMSGYAYGQGGERSMFPMAFSDGFLYFLGGWYGMGSTSWLDIVAYASGGVSGNYSTEYWSGDFHAENCGEWAGSNQDWETGW